MNALIRTTDVERKATFLADNFSDESLLYKHAPSLFTTHAHPSMSQKYSFTNTYEIVKYAQTKGFHVSSIMGGTTAYAALIVRMRMPDHGKKEDGGAPELIIGDSHNGTKPAKLLLGYINFLCMNGLIAGDILYNRKFIHRTRDLMHQLRLELEDIDASVRNLMQRVNAMRAYNTTVGEQIALTDAAMEERFVTRSDQTLSGDFKVDMRRKLLHRNRDGDKRNDMFTIMNVIQENLIRGGAHYISSTSNRLIRMKPIAAVDRNMNINQRIWIEAERIMSNALEVEAAADASMASIDADIDEVMK